MFTSLISRPWIARSALLSLVLGSVLVGSTPANAEGIGPVSPDSTSFNRYSDDGIHLNINPGESMDIDSSTELMDDWAGWPLKRGAKLTRTAMTQTLPTGVEKSDSWRSWNGYAFDSEDCDGLWDDALGHTITANETCIDYLRVSDNVTVTNSSLGTQTIGTNADSQVLKNGKSVLTNQEGVYSTLTGRVTGTDSTVTLADGDDSLSLHFRGCIDESVLDTNGEDLTVVLALTLDGEPLEQGTDYSFWFDDETYIDTLTDPEVITFKAPSEEDFGGHLENLEVQVGADLSGEPVPGTYSGTLDVTNSSDESVLEACPPDNPDPTFPASIGHVDYAAQPAITISSAKPLPVNIDQTKDDFGLYSSTADGFGGLFYMTYSSDPYVAGTTPVAKIVHMDSSGADENFNNLTGVLSTSVGRYGQLDVGRYDANGSRWFAIAPTSTSWSITKGSMTSGASTTLTISSKTLAKSCPAKYKPYYMSGISAPTVNPTAALLCLKGQQMSYGIVSLTATGSTLLKQLGSATTASPCVIPQFGMNPSATSGTDIALAVYTRTSSRSDDGSCGAVLATTTARSLTTISQAGSVVTASVPGDPWQSVEPGSAELAPANDQGTSWIGISTDAVYNGDPSSLTYSFTISNAATAPTLTVNTDNLIAPDHDFGPWAWVRPLYRVSNTSWLVATQGEIYFDGESTAKYSVGVLDVTTGEITDGQTGTMSGYGGWSSGRIGSSLSLKAGKANGAYWYVLTDADSPHGHYKVASWSYVPD